MFQKTIHESKGQALVEFALVIVILLLFLFIIIEGGRLFQAWVTVQNAARSAGRYALTGQYDNTGTFDTPECPPGTPVDRWQVCSIKDRAFQAASGLNINRSAGPNQPEAFGTQICQPNNCPPEGTGLPGEPTRVSVFYNVGLITPLLRPFARFVRVTGQVEVVTAQYDQVSPGDIVVANVGSGVGGPLFPNEADIAITKGPLNGTGDAMEPVDYTMTVRNFGPFSTPTIEIVDFLPSRTISVTNYTITDGIVAIPEATCSFSQLDQQIACTIPYLDGDPDAPGTAFINLKLLIAPEELEANPYQSTAVVTNTATVFNQIATIDPDFSNNEDSVQTSIRRWYDLAISKTHAPGQSTTVNLNETVDYVIRVENLGPNTAHDAVISDPLPAQLQFTTIVSQTANANCSQSGNGIECLPSPLAYEEYAAVRVRALVIQDNGNDPTNTAQVAPGNPTDDDMTNNVDSADPTIITSPQLEVTKSIAPVIYTDEIATFTIDVTNVDILGVAKQVVLTDDMQPGNGVTFSYESLIPDAPAQCEIQASQDILCQGFDILPGQTWSLEVRIEPDLSLDPLVLDSNLTNVVNVSSNGGYYVAPSESATTTVRRLYDLDVTKTDDQTNLADGIISYDVEVHNNGPSTSPPFTIEDDLLVRFGGPSVLPTVVAVDGTYIGSVNDCSPSANAVDCSVASLPAGATAYFTIDVDLTGFSGEIRNRASVIDTEASNDNDTDSTTRIIYPYALEVEKSGPSSGQQGEAAEYTVSVTNRGPLPATFTISDTLETTPEDLIDSISLSVTNADCPAVVSGSFECTVTDLSPGASATIIATVTPNSGGSLINTVSVDDPDNVLTGSNPDSATVTTSFSPQADLGLELALSSAVSETVVLQLNVTNDGPSIAETLRITDTITVISGTVVTATMSLDSDLSAPCDQVSNSLSKTISLVCDIASLGVGERSLFVKLVFADESGNEFESDALVQSETYDPGPNINTGFYKWP